MRTVVFSRQSRQQLLDLYDYIAEASSPDVAYRFTSDLRGYCLGLATFPQRGTRHNAVLPNLRSVAFRRRATVAYVVGEAHVRIVGIYYGGRDWRSLVRS